MLNKSVLSRSALGALVLAAATALPAVAQAHDNDYRDYSGRYDRQYDRGYDRYDQRWAHRSYWDRDDARRYWHWRRMHDGRFDGSRAYYAPAYTYSVPAQAPVIVFGGRW